MSKAEYQLGLSWHPIAVVNRWLKRAEAAELPHDGRHRLTSRARMFRIETACLLDQRHGSISGSSK